MPPRWESLETAARKLRSGESGVPPFHWSVEFPEVFARENGGFDGIVGNPPFLGGTSISEKIGMKYFQYLSFNYPPAGHHCDLVGYFFKRAFELLRLNGAMGLVATNTIAQGDTREGSLAPILSDGGSIYRALRRYVWPGEAAVIVSVIHILKGEPSTAVQLNGRIASRISAFLIDGNQDKSPEKLRASPYFSLGCKIYGQGFPI